MKGNTHPAATIPAATHPRFVLHRQLEPEFGIKWSNVHILRLEKEGKFPRRIPLGNNSVAWLFSDLVEWVEDRIAKAPAARAAQSDRAKAQRVAQSRGAA